MRVAQDGANDDAIGAFLDVRVGDTTQEREVTVGGGHVSGQLGPVHLGLGSADRAEVRVTWPDGSVGPWMPVTANQTVLVEKGATSVRPLP